MQVSNIKLLGNLSNESRPDTCGQTDEHKANWSLCDCTREHKNLLWERRRKISEATFRLRWISGVKHQPCYLPLGVPKDICTCQLHVILSPKTPWSTFRADSRVISDRNFWAGLKPTSVTPHFPKSLLLLRALMEAVQSVVTVKCALDLSLYNVITHVYRIKINCFLSVRGKMSKRNIKF